MNSVILSGRLVRDPEIRVTAGDKPMTVANYTLAVNRIGKDRGADFIPCVAFGKNGEFAEKYLKKGIRIIVEGRIQTGSYTGKDGHKVNTFTCVANSHEFAESKQQAEPQKQEQPSAAPGGIDGFMDIPPGIDEELPFS